MDTLPAIFACAALLGGCTLVRPQVAAVPKRDDSAPTTLDPRLLEDELRKTIYQSYRALSGRVFEDYLDGVEHDRQLLMINVGPEDVISGYDSAVVHIHELFPGLASTVLSKSLEIHLSADASVGWTYDELSYRVSHAGRRVIVPLRATAVYERRGSEWLLVQEHVSYGVPAEDAIASRVVPELFGAHNGDDERVPAIIEKLLGGEGSSRDDALLVGVDYEMELRGAHKVTQVVPGNVHSLQDLRVRVSRSGQVAWAAANLVVTPESATDGQAAFLRATMVLELRGEHWQVVQVHISAPVTQSELSMKVFSKEIPLAPRRRGPRVRIF